MLLQVWPSTFQEASEYFSNPDTAFSEMVKLRWSDGVARCPVCGSTDLYFTKTRRLWQCKGDHARRQFSVKIGSIMEGSAIDVGKWLLALWLIANSEHGISSYEVGRLLGVTQKSAWLMLDRIRLAVTAQEQGSEDLRPELDTAADRSDAAR